MSDRRYTLPDDESPLTRLFFRLAWGLFILAVIFGIAAKVCAQDVLVPCYEPKVGMQAIEKALVLGRTKRLCLILNPNSGPGVKVDAAYAALLKRALGCGAQTLGYIDLIAWPGDGLTPKNVKAAPKTSAQLTSEHLAYQRFYPGLSGWFVDDVAPSLKQSLQLVAAWEGRCVLNPGCAFDLPFPWPGVVVVISEQAKAWPRSLTSWEHETRKQCAVMGLKISHGSLPAFMASTAGMAMRYASPLSDAQGAYDTLTPYFTQLLR